MKKTIKYLLFPVLFIVSMISCEDEDKAPFITSDQELRGAFFRTIDFGGIINRTDIAGSVYSVTGELVSEGNGTDVSNVQMWVEFVDRNTDGDPATDDDESIASVLFDSADVSTFSTSANGFPQKTFDVSIADAMSTLGLELSKVEGGDQFLFQIAINMADGRSFSKENTGDSVSGELFFSSPMVYTGLVVCVLDSPPTGDWVIDMEDSYGDGWQGSAVVMSIDGVETNVEMLDFWTAGLPYSNIFVADSQTINVPSSTSTLTFSWIAGDYPGECSFKIYAPSGNLVAEGGPGPLVGEIQLNLCNE